MRPSPFVRHLSSSPFVPFVYSTIGLGAIISRATESNNVAMLLGATVVMAALVVTVNRLFWRRMYGLASTRYKLET
jgi:NitT/TauT family transport system permease protein